MAKRNVLNKGYDCMEVHAWQMHRKICWRIGFFSFRFLSVLYSYICDISVVHSCSYMFHIANSISKRLFSSMCNKPRNNLPRTVLPESVQAIKYSVHLEPCLQSFVFGGRQTVSLNLLSPVTSITLHAKDLLIDPIINFTSSDGKKTQATEVSHNNTDTTVTMNFGCELPAGEGQLDMTFQGHLNDQMVGFYRSGYLDLYGKKQYIGTTQMEAIDARRMFPCIDEPAAKAIFELSVTAPSDLSILSNMPESKRTLRLKGDAVVQDVQFMPSPKMSTYLVALCLGHFEYVQATTKRGTLVRVLATPGKASQCTFALDVGVRCLEWYEDFFDVVYPLPKLDMIGVPDFAMGAMENWGLVTYREIDLLCDLETVSAVRMQRLASVVTHELSHQWFGNLVTMEWWDDLWLNEGFATFMQTLSADALFPEWKLWDQYIGDDLDRARSLDGLRSSHPVQVPIPKAEDVEQVFDAISYSKGACVVRVIYHVLGDETFKRGIRAYMKKHAYGNTVTDDLWDSFQEALGDKADWTVRELMGSWTQQTGYPVLKVKIGADKKSLDITQEYFVADGSVKPEDEKLHWMVPVFVGSSKNADKPTMHIIREKKSSIPFPDGLDAGSLSSNWVKLNFGEIAPIRVQYESPELLEALLRSAKSLSVPDRVGLLSDARALARAGRNSLSSVVKILKSYAKSGEENADVWTAIESSVMNIDKIVCGMGKSNELNALVIALVKPQLERIGWDQKQTDGDGEKRLRSCLFRLMSSFATSAPEGTELRKEAIRRFNEYKVDPLTKLIVDDTRSAIFKLALTAPELTDKGASNYEFLKNKVEHHHCSQTDKLNIYSAMGYVSDVSLKRATLDWTLTDKIKTQDFFYPIGPVRSSNAEGSELAWTWMKANFPKCKERLAKASPSLLASVIAQACGGNVLRERADEIEKTYGGMPSISRIIAQLVEGIRSNAAFLEREQKTGSALDNELWKL
jgi:aminopeptidase N